MIRVACATNNMASYYQRWFPGLTVIGHEDNVTPIDLLILTGGEDINPARYRERINGAFPGRGDRDEREFNILRQAIQKNHRVKVLGVCRGHQLLNVFFGGTLWQDLDSQGMAHRGVHAVSWDTRYKSHPLHWIEKVNSLHHQAVRDLGYDNGPTFILAQEPASGIPEIVSFGSNCLGVQFHPELSDTLGDKFFPIIKNWVEGDIDLAPTPDMELEWFPDDDEETDDDEDREEEDDEEFEEFEEEATTAPNPTSTATISTIWSTGMDVETANRQYHEMMERLRNDIEQRRQRDV